MNPVIHRAFTIVATIVVALAIGWGFVLVGSPIARRAQRFDEQRLQDLRTIANEIRLLCADPDDSSKLKQPLPKSLEEAAQRAQRSKLNLLDPETGAPYQYRVLDESHFELCATFTQERNWDATVFWNHPVGPHCYNVNVLDPPPY